MTYPCYNYSKNESTLFFFFKALIPKLRDQDPNVVISVLAAIGEHAQASRHLLDSL